MKTIIAAIIAFCFALPAFAGGEAKQVCKDVVGKDGKVVVQKDGKPKQTCKTIKVHKKLEGTEIPVKK